MTYLEILRRLASNQQFEELKNRAEQYWAESSDVGALPLLTFALVSMGLRAEADTQFKLIDFHHEKFDLDGRVDLAACYIATMQTDQACDVLHAALQENPEHPLALARLAWCRTYEHRFEEARVLYEQSEAALPGQLPLYINLIQLCVELEDSTSAQSWLDKAISRFEQLYAELPHDVAKLNTLQLRQLQLAIWALVKDYAQIEAWLEEKRSSLEEDEWVALVIAYANILGHHDAHEQAVELYQDGVKHYPDNIDLYQQMADLFQLQGLMMQAVNVLHKAIQLSTKLDKPTAGLWAKLSSVYLHQNELKACQAAEKSVEISAALEVGDHYSEMDIKILQMQAKYALAQVESQKQHFDAAEALFRELLDENPYFLPALQGLGHQQMQCGHIDEAVELFERMKAIAPVKGYSALINARQFPDNEDTLYKMEKAARKPSMEGGVSTGLLFQLASAWEKRKQYDKAFALAVDANTSTRRFLKYDSQEHRNHCARIRAGFCAELYEHRKDCGVDSTLPIYVLGMPRSGTTLVEQILAGHSDIFGAGELSVIPQVIQGLLRWERHTGSGRSYPECVDDLNAYVTEGIANNVLKELQEYEPNAKHVVDKLPHNFENIGLIKFLFPNAKIISVRRDPRDIALSNYFTDYQAKFGGMGFAYDLTDTGKQLADHNLLMHHWNQVFPGEILEMNYEDVVADTEGAARKMLAYIGVQWQPQVLAFNDLDRPVKTASVWQVRQPIYKTSMAKWMRYEKQLAPLLAGTNAKIEPDPITDMERLPVPGLLVDGVELYKDEKLDEAEYKFKQLLHHIPEHAAANFMLGLIYVHKNHFKDAITLMEKAYEVCPWKHQWRHDLIQAYALGGEKEKATELSAKHKNLTKGLSEDMLAGNELDMPIAAE